MTKQDIHIRITIEDVSMPVSLTFIKNNTRMIGNVTGIHVTERMELQNFKVRLSDVRMALVSFLLVDTICIGSPM